MVWLLVIAAAVVAAWPQAARAALSEGASAEAALPEASDAPPAADPEPREVETHLLFEVPGLAGSPEAVAAAVPQVEEVEEGEESGQADADAPAPWAAVAGHDTTLDVLEAPKGGGWIAGGLVGLAGGVALATHGYAELEPAGLDVEALLGDRTLTTLQPTLGVGASSLLVGYAALRLGLHRRGQGEDAALRWRPQVSVGLEGYSVGLALQF
ncbi:hypothetical protein PPSIR1_21679 [Plesiocystis pacifica SIR-1]|uniref:Uncharacterized protein n=1 Tax=Plesiocystis pacifica SIR-1 TaxID=391625 RepID=A6FXI3_9BACT|nr:hypothetical protein [Plesiocystis pacifica]EDM81571.1 hypothetical protein PPSIR1_21679 [Plesiocystis pacifica SIR-1]